MSAERTRVTQSLEEPFFFSLGSERLFGMLHRPAHDASTVVVFCHALAEEKLWSHRCYVSFARECAAAGVAVLRFDCRGEGDSDREFIDTSIRTRLEDIDAAIMEAIRRLQPKQVIAAGHRLGALLAATAATQTSHPVVAALLWDPVIDGKDYFGQLLRSNLATQLAVQGKVTRTRDVLIQDLMAGQPIEVDGYAFTREFYQELEGLRWPPDLHALPRGALVLEIGKLGQTEPSNRVAEVSADNVRCEVVQEPPFWRETKQFHRRAANLNAASLTWLQELDRSCAS